MRLSYVRSGLEADQLMTFSFMLFSEALVLVFRLTEYANLFCWQFKSYKMNAT
jgi:hypothetical protein